MRMIDADALIAQMEADAEKMDEPIAQMFVYAAINDIKHAPTIERKTGKWEERKVSSEKVIDEWQSARCSVCGKYHTAPYLYYFDDFSFCPNCGARMER